ncbi:MAG TPA: serine hydrolase domain-containing protein [Verrucomicrobiae bacterium]|nr:serine hydrolase domain-containing protein [Verrucomicrobiae bacterium]
MDFEDLQKSWQSSNPAARITISADLLLKEVRRNQKQFWLTIFMRDAREVVVIFSMALLFAYWGLSQNNWTLLLIALGCLFVCSFFVVDRLIQRKKKPAANDALKACVETSLHQVNHQIWLLKNIFWWYLLPCVLPLGISIGASFWHSRYEGASAVAGWIAYIFICIFIYWGVYWINQRCVRKTLAPRRQELEGLLAGLGLDSPQPETRNSMRYQILISILVIAALAIAITFAATGPSFTRSSGPPKSNDPAQAMKSIRNNYNLPALAVVVVKDGVICDREAVGVRKSGDPTPITTNDVFHIGSCTKSMTAVLAGMLVDEGKLRWDTTIGEVFPELRGKMDKQYENVTVEQLLTHRGGAPSDPPPAAWRQAWKQQGTPMEQRRQFIEAVLSKPPAATPGTKMIYSNQGYAIAGAMLEKITGTAWETLITERLFKPLHMDTAGFGPPGTIGQVDQPWGHSRKFFINTPVQIDNPPAIGPAGRVHCSLDDFARYAIFQMEDQPPLLKPETFAKLHTAPSGSDYACGWIVLRRSWAGGKALYHNGSNTTFYFQVWLAPHRKFAVITATNTGAENAFNACDDADVYMIRHWLNVDL